MRLTGLFLLSAAMLFIIALVIGTGSQPWQVAANSIAPNNLSGLLAGGFAVSGGLSLIAASIAGNRPATFLIEAHPLGALRNAS